MRVSRVALALLIGVLLAEVGLRIWPPAVLDRVGQWFDVTEDFPFHPSHGSWDFDAETGFAPVLGSGAYSHLGALSNDYPEVKGDVRRVALLGDSVMRRGVLAGALRKRFPDPDVEWWNFGVEGWTPVEALVWFERHVLDLRPDRALLLVHWNDYDASHVVMRALDGSLTVFTPHASIRGINPLLFQYSRLYLLGLALRAGTGEGRSTHENQSERIRAALTRLDELCNEHEIELTVGVFPPCLPEDTWPASFRATQADALKIVEDLGLPTFDLLAALRRAEASGDPLQASQGDAHHPSEGFAAEIAESLFASGWRP